MNGYELLGLALALAMDAFAVSLTAGATIKRITPRHYFRLSFHFGLFQFMMPVLGWSAGILVYRYIAALDHWIAFSLLALIGTHMIIESRNLDDKKRREDPSRGWRLIALSIATSIDALAVGVTLAFLQVEIWYASVIIGIVAAAASIAGIRLGDAFGKRIGKRAELIGGLILIAIGVKILIEHVYLS